MWIPQELQQLLKGGISDTVDFIVVNSEVPESVYEVICAFANRDGGHLFLGVREDGQVVGIRAKLIEQFKRQIEADVRDEKKMHPGMDLHPVCYEADGKRILYVQVPPSDDVSYWMGSAWDRQGDCNADITGFTEAMLRLYLRKGRKSYTDTVTRLGIQHLRHDLIDRARAMTNRRTQNHPWKGMSDEEMLRDAGLLRRHEFEGFEGITIAGVLLFGTDGAIRSVLSWYSTDAIFRVFQMDRYDDRDVVETNLLDAYDRLLKFGQKHLNDPFCLEGCLRVSARDHILHEIISNLLVHRDYSSGIRAQFVIERERIYTRNGSISHGSGPLDLAGGQPYAKNPTLAKVFREIGLMEGTGNGVRTTAKYTKMYSGFEPRFTEGDVFETVIPLSEAATVTVGPVRAAGK